MTYLWPNGSQIMQLQCQGTTKRLKRCKVRCLGFEGEVYYCPRHRNQKPPVPGRIVGGRADG